MKCSGACAGPDVCTCPPRSQDQMLASLQQIAVLLEQNPSLLYTTRVDDDPTHVLQSQENPARRFGSSNALRQVVSTGNLMSDTKHHKTQFGSQQGLHHSLVIVPEPSKYAAPTNLDTLFRHENISFISSTISRLCSSAIRTRDKFTNKSSDILRALPRSQGVHVIIGILFVYYAMPNSVGLNLARRIFDLVVVKNILLMNSWNVLFEFLDESAGHRHSVVPM
jgi:hypothetical protein